MLAQVLERIITFAASDQESLVAAREEWASAAGRVFDDDALYEERTVAFLEWFALERPGRGGKVPVDLFLAEHAADAVERAWVLALRNSHRSLFEVKQMLPGVVMLDDLLGGGVFAVAERRQLPGVAEGEILEARLVANISAPPELLFSRALQFHPREAAAQLKRLAARAGAEGRTELLFRLARLRLKALRYQHVGADKIYAADDAA